MEDVLEKVSPKRAKTTTHPDYPGVEFDENGEPIGKTIVEIMDKLDRKCIDFYGEYGRRIVNARREEWNRDGMWHFELF